MAVATAITRACLGTRRWLPMVTMTRAFSICAGVHLPGIGAEAATAGTGVQEALRQLFEIIGTTRAREVEADKPVLVKDDTWQP
jgi:hypothetical protein